MGTPEQFKKAADIQPGILRDQLEKTIAWRSAPEKTAEYRRAQRRFSAGMKRLGLDPYERLHVHLALVSMADAVIRGDATLAEETT